MNDPVLKIIRDLVVRQPAPHSGESSVPDPMAMLVEEMHRRHGTSIAAILVYGSYLRGQRDTLLDFYVLLEDFTQMPKRWHGYSVRILAPNVYNIVVGEHPNQARAKYAALSVAQFERAMTGQFHSYFWARFAQPCALVYTKNSLVEQQVLLALRSAVYTFCMRVLPLMQGSFTSFEFWRTGLMRTYGCELRAESIQQAEKLTANNAEYFARLTQAMAPELGVDLISEGVYQSNTTDEAHSRALRSWSIRRIQGKLISIGRLLKAVSTFENSLEYLLWKIERHSGIYIQPSPRQLRYPLIFAWPLLWRLYRSGAFK